MIDFSFFKLEPSINEALRLSQDSPLASLRYYQNIQLSPDEKYLQILNTANGIEFNGDYTAFIVDCAGTDLLDITNKTFIYEFTDSNGLSQIAIELLPIGTDFYRKAVFIRLKHTTSNSVYFTVPLNISNYQIEQTTRFDYKHFNRFHGIDYQNANFYQSIRVRSWYDRKANNTEFTDYYQISTSNTISVRPLYKQVEIYKTEFLTEFATERIDLILMHDIIYVDNVRMTNKTIIDNSERVGETNLREGSEFTVSKNYSDLFTSEFQIFEPLDIIANEPGEIVTLQQYMLSEIVTVTFNKNVSLLTGTMTVYDNTDDTVLGTVNQTAVTFLFSYLPQFDLTGIITTTGQYRFELSAGMFQSEYDELNEYYSWVTDIVDGEYENTEYDLNEYLTN